MDLSHMSRQQLRDLMLDASKVLADRGEQVTITYQPRLQTWSPFDMVTHPAEHG